MSFWEDLKLALAGARNPQLANQIEKGIAKELEQDNNPAGKNIVIPYNAMQPREKGLYDGNIVDDHLRRYYDVGYGNPTHGTNEVYNPISGLSSGLYTVLEYDSEGNPYISNKHMSRHYGPDPTTAYSGFYRSNVLENNLYEQDNKQGVTVNAPTPEQLQMVTPIVESNTKQEQQTPSRRDLYNQNQGGGISTQEAYRRQKLLREKGYNVSYDGYYGDASRKAWAEYQASLTPEISTSGLAVAPSVTKPVTTPKAVDPNSPEAARQRFLDQQQAKIATAKMPSQFANIDIMGAMKAEEARKKAELEALMQKQGAGSNLFNTDPHNIQGGYVVPVEPQYDMSKLDTHNQFGLKFYKGGMIPKHQNASGEELKEKEKEPLTSYFTSGYFRDENGNPIVSEYGSINGYHDGENYNMQREIISKNGQKDTLFTNNGKYIVSHPDSTAKYNKIFEDLIKLSEYIPSDKQGGSLKKCSCGCKTLLKKGKGGKVMESRNCK